ncbi:MULTISPECIES: diacylglycerol/polyprenol kinase family protein [Pseudanabaena]|uniref:Phosphatidate cytidylyltransferase n=2 Tax=Pseudanabaena TaxID=1152 RepID=L8N070_9CYAN|nr:MULTISPECIES: diacylglycerol/polyprenol kinase family protein [Pseudanabaena]ELS32135.1 phosphatidate cytidylyltransferase [Pseudanabaena biceps PCC 7429]MDG3495617.1 SEC59/DGK1/VTE5 family protein [Pseudanabaena catenata USMAC16]
MIATSEISPIATLSMQISAVLVWLGLVFLTSNILHRFKQDPELVRKVVHIGTGNVLLIAWWLHFPTWLCVSAGVTFSAIALASHYISVLPMLNDVGRKTYGIFYYALSITILVALLWDRFPEYAVIGVMVMSWGDGMAALIGKRFGKHTFVHMGNKRSLEGSFAMFVTSAIVMVIILVLANGFRFRDLGVVIPVAAIAAILEAFSPGGTDNISVPLSSAFLSYLLESTL